MIQKAITGSVDRFTRRGEDPRLAIGQTRQPDGVTLDAVWAAYAAAGYPKLRGVGHKRASTIRRCTSSPGSTN